MVSEDLIRLTFSRYNRLFFLRHHLTIFNIMNLLLQCIISPECNNPPSSNYFNIYTVLQLLALWPCPRLQNLWSRRGKGVGLCETLDFCDLLRHVFSHTLTTKTLNKKMMFPSSFLRIWSHLLTKSFLENFIFSTVECNASLSTICNKKRISRYPVIFEKPCLSKYSIFK